MWYRASNLQNLYAPRKSSAGRQTLSPRFRFTARNVALPERVPLTDCGSRPQDMDLIEETGRKRGTASAQT